MVHPEHCEGESDLFWAPSLASSGLLGIFHVPWLADLGFQHHMAFFLCWVCVCARVPHIGLGPAL